MSSFADATLLGDPRLLRLTPRQARVTVSVASQLSVLPAEADDEREPGAWSLVTLLAALLGGMLVALVVVSRVSPWLAMCVLVMVLSIIALLNPRTAIFLTLPYMAVQGDVRRVLSLGMPAGSDPLVLVGPIIVMLLTSVALLQNRLKRGTPLAKLVLILLMIMGVQVLNPRQGGLMVGVMGVLCVMVPMCWFWVGQAWGNARFVDSFLYGAVVPTAVVAGVFGFVQVFVGRPEYQEAWVQLLYAGRPHTHDINRPFGFFISVSEFTKFLSVGLLLLIASLFVRKPRLMLLGFPVMATSLFLASARGPIMGCCGSIVFLSAMLAKTRAGAMARVAAASVLLLGGLAWTMSELNDLEFESAGMEYLVKHQTEGLLNPLDEKKSTGVGHAHGMVSGVVEGIKRPLGIGLGAATHVSSSYGGLTAAKEVDVSNMFVCLGVVGGVLYALLYYRVYSGIVRTWVATRAPLLLSLMAVLMALNLNWLNTGEYSTVALAWFCVGVLDRQMSRTSAAVST